MKLRNFEEYILITTLALDVYNRKQGKTRDLKGNKNQ